VFNRLRLNGIEGKNLGELKKCGKEREIEMECRKEVDCFCCIYYGAN
jgi:hypothetical protein